MLKTLYDKMYFFWSVEIEFRLLMLVGHMDGFAFDPVTGDYVKTYRSVFPWRK